MDQFEAYRKVVDQATGAIRYEEIPTGMVSRGVEVSASGSEDTAIQITVPAGSTLMVGVLALFGPDASLLKITDGTNDLFMAQTESMLQVSDPFRSPIVAYHNSGTSDATVSVTITGTAGNEYYVSIGYIII